MERNVFLHGFRVIPSQCHMENYLKYTILLISVEPKTKKWLLLVSKITKELKKLKDIHNIFNNVRAKKLVSLDFQMEILEESSLNLEMTAICNLYFTSIKLNLTNFLNKINKLSTKRNCQSKNSHHIVK